MPRYKQELVYLCGIYFLGDEMNRVREVRLEKGMTQDDLSEISKVNQRHISLIENDLKPNLSLSVAKRIAKALGKTVDYLWPD